MSHNTEYATYPENVNRKKVKKEWDNFVAIVDKGEGASGLPSDIRWVENTICASESDAYDYIEKHDKGWYDCLAVRFRETVVPKSKAYAELVERLNSYREDLHQLTTKQHYSTTTVKSEFVTCKQCGSKIAVRFLRGNNCPVCGRDMRPESTLKRILQMQNTLRDMEERKAEMEKKASEKAPLSWLLKIEYHT